VVVIQIVDRDFKLLTATLANKFLFIEIPKYFPTQSSITFAIWKFRALIWARHGCTFHINKQINESMLISAISNVVFPALQLAHHDNL
jgi:hypothetical protein